MSSVNPVVTRFAPSPTGSLHIGGARTALFNYLYAKHTGGKFVLRIEDTDRERSTEANVQVILDGLTWLGLTWDGEPTFQYARGERHRAAVDQLLAEGKAYPCWLAGDELAAAKDAARAAGHALRSPWRDREVTAENLARPHVIRFRGPLNGDTRIQDLVQGPVTLRNRELDDLILLRSDGVPTYNLAVIVDDHEMGVTHVIRGDDHLNNAARQTLLYQALGWPVPAFAHISMIHGPDGGKLSKRHGAQAVGEFADMGYLPEALRNYLARLGWSHGDDELFSDQQAADWFDIADVNKGAARLDWDKLNHVNAHYIRLADDDRLARLVTEVCLRRNEPLDEASLQRLYGAIGLMKDRGKTLVELADQCAFLFLQRPVTIEEKARSLLTAETLERLARLRTALDQEASWSPESLDIRLKSFAEAEAVGMGKIGPPMRAVLTGGQPSPDLGRTLAALGRSEVLGRMDDVLSPLS
ncbi:MAG: glutamate--tRNA ligase [Caulobacter sp.]|nr:glutamate--tRNA ligase [Caulobacter sp.]